MNLFPEKRFYWKAERTGIKKSLARLENGNIKNNIFSYHNFICSQLYFESVFGLSTMEIKMFNKVDC